MSRLIVCATDLSPASEGAHSWAATMARRTGAIVDLVHVLPVAIISVETAFMDNVRLEGDLVEQATQHLRDQASTLAEQFGVLVRPHVLRGEPHEEILKHAREGGAGVVVLGTGSMALVEQWVLGSVAGRTIRFADRPVVVVPRRHACDVWATTPGAQAGQRAPRVLAALGEGSAEALLRFVGDLRREAPCDVTFLHLYWPIEEYARLGLQGRRDLFQTDPDVVTSLEPSVRAKLSGLVGNGLVSVDIRPAWGEPATNLLTAVEDAEADLLVVGAHQRHGVARLLSGSIAQRLARRSHDVPVVIIPDDPTPAARPAAIPTLKTVLAVTDLSAHGNAAVAHAYGLVRHAGGAVELCHVREHALPTPAYAYDDLATKMTAGDRERLLGELRALVPDEARLWGVATHVSIIDGGKAGEAIVQAAERLDVDAIVMASRGRTGVARTILGSVAQDVVHRSHRPVYIVRGR